jgi:hypothetical protein
MSKWSTKAAAIVVVIQYLRHKNNNYVKTVKYVKNYKFRSFKNLCPPIWDDMRVVSLSSITSWQLSV